jgi:hypothetical protein
MTNFGASSGADGGGCHLGWDLAFNDAADTVTITAVHTRFDGSAAPAPQVAKMTITLNTSVAITLDLLTGRLGGGQAFDGTATAIINSGPRVRTGVRLKVSADRAALITHSTEYQPPAA